jgi:hypothetical protein
LTLLCISCTISGSIPAEKYGKQQIGTLKRLMTWQGLSASVKHQAVQMLAVASVTANNCQALSATQHLLFLLPL